MLLSHSSITDRNSIAELRLIDLSKYHNEWCLQRPNVGVSTLSGSIPVAGKPMAQNSLAQKPFFSVGNFLPRIRNRSAGSKASIKSAGSSVVASDAITSGNHVFYLSHLDQVISDRRNDPCGDLNLIRMDCDSPSVRYT